VVASGPAGPRRRLGAELRRLRNGAGLHLDEVAGRLRCSTSKISRLETGKGIPKGADVRELMRIYGVAADPEGEMLLRLVRESRTEGWWESYTEGVRPEPFVLDDHARYTALETEASAVRSFDQAALHGLLQVPRYTRGLMEALLPDHSSDQIEQLVELRGRRQEALTRSERPLELAVVLDEAVLNRRVGDAGVMREQLRSILDLSELPSVQVQVLPFEAGVHRVHAGGFNILEFAADELPDVVYRETGGEGEYLENVSDVDLYKVAFADVTDRALAPDASRALIGRYVEDSPSSGKARLPP
jgi:transcriptional regulator with XRE-family HTH domain